MDEERKRQLLKLVKEMGTDEFLETLTPEQQEAALAEVEKFISDAPPPPLTLEGLRQLQEANRKEEQALLQAVEASEQLAVETVRAAETAAKTGREDNSGIEKANKAYRAAVSNLNAAHQANREAIRAAGLFTVDAAGGIHRALADFDEWFAALRRKEVSQLTADELFFFGILQAAAGKEKELADVIQAETGGQPVTVDEFFCSVDKDGQPVESIYSRVLKRLQKSKYFPMFHGKGTDGMAAAVGKRLTPDETGDVSTVAGGVSLLIEEYTRYGSPLSVSAQQLFCKAVIEFTRRNYAGKNRGKPEFDVSFSLKEYLQLCGYNTDVKSELDAGRKKVKKDLNALFRAYGTWREKVNGKTESFGKTRYLSAVSIDHGNIVVEFSPSVGRYLLQCPLTQYPESLYRIDGHHASAYSVGYKLWEHFNMDNNQRRGTAQVLKVKNILKATKLPDVKSESVKKNGWEIRIKEPLEEILNYLVGVGVLESWRYSRPKGVEMATEETANFPRYSDWAETLVHFTLRDAPDHAERLEAKKSEEESKPIKGKNAKKR